MSMEEFCCHMMIIFEVDKLKREMLIQNHMDSLDRTEIIMLAEGLGVELQDAEIRDLQTWGELLDVIERKL